MTHKPQHFNKATFKKKSAIQNAPGKYVSVSSLLSSYYITFT